MNRRNLQVSDRILVSIGANLGDPEAMIREVIHGISVDRNGEFLVSHLWKTSPVDCPPDSPVFVNAAVVFHPKTHETPEALLDLLQEMERKMGRRPKKVMNEARLVDLDLIAWEDLRTSRPQLTLPHPRAHLRSFVLTPLAEIVPDFILPGQTVPIRKLLENLETREILEMLPQPPVIVTTSSGRTSRHSS